MSYSAEFRDDTTRYLCAAAHLNPGYADEVIREYLVEPARATPPTPGVNCGLVLREAVASIARGKARDRLLVALAVVFLASLADLLPITGITFDVRLTVCSVATLLILCVLYEDRRIVWALLARSFQRDQFLLASTDDVWGGEWFYRRLGHIAYESRLARYAAQPADTGAEVIVYRGNRPFVGSGNTLSAWSMAFPLKSTSDLLEPRFDLTELYDHVTTELLKVGRSPSLSPSHRLRSLAQSDRVVVSAAELVDHLDDDAAEVVLPNRNERPLPRADQSVVDGLIARPLEWMRHFRCFEVEAWDRDIVLSAYLTFGLDDEMLYVEWTPCVLPPIASHLRVIDEMPPWSWKPVSQALSDLLLLPLTFLKRLKNALTALPTVRWMSGAPTPATYGAARSLRELAAGSVQDYFQDTDVKRYVKVLESRLLRALGEFLEDKGISVTEFMERATQVTNHNVHITGPVIGSNVNTRGKGIIGDIKVKLKEAGK